MLFPCFSLLVLYGIFMLFTICYFHFLLFLFYSPKYDVYVFGFSSCNNLKNNICQILIIQKCFKAIFLAKTKLSATENEFFLRIMNFPYLF